MSTKIIRFLFFSLFFLTPLIFTSFNSELFELPKMYFVHTLTVLILALHLANYLSGKVIFFRSSPVTIPFLLFLFSQVVSTFFSIDPQTSIFGYYSRLNGGLLSLLSYFFLYQILIIYLDDQFRDKIISVSLLSGFLVAAYGISQHFGIDSHLWVQDVASRVFSTLGQPNWLAAYLCILLPLALDRFLNSKNLYRQGIALPLPLIFYLCLLFTKSKTGLIAAAITLGIYFLIYFLKNKSTPKYGQAIGLSLLFIAFSLIINNPIKDFFFPKSLKIENPKIENLNITPSENIRQIVWTGAIKLWQKFPLFGTGPETFAYSYYWTRPAAHNLTSEWDFIYNKAHNEYLNYLATTGLFGFLTYLILIILILRQFRSYGQGNALSLLIPFLSILITNLTGFSVVITSLYFFLLPALCSTDRPLACPYNQKSFFLKFFLLFFTFYLLSKILFFYLADITYAASIKYDTIKQYSPAYDQIRLSLGYRPNCPTYLSQASTLAAKLALTTKDQKYLNDAIKFSNAAIAISPASTNILKERAQVFYYLSGLDSSHLVTAVKTLTDTAVLAPTDAKTFYLLGQFLETAGKADTALTSYRHAADLKSNYDHALFALGRLYFEAKDYPAAKDYFQKVLEIAPANSDAKDYLNKIPN